MTITWPARLRTSLWRLTWSSFAKTQPRELEVTDRVWLAPQSAICSVRWKGRGFLVGVTGQNVQLIASETEESC